MDGTQGNYSTRGNPGKHYDRNAEETAPSSTHQMTAASSQQPHIYRPIPRRNFSHNNRQPNGYSNGFAAQNGDASRLPDPFVPSSPPTLHDSNNRSSDFLAQLNAKLLRSSNGYTHDHGEDDTPPERNKSFLNMKSTLFGIYDEVDTSTTGVPGTPLQTGAETPFGALYDGNNNTENGMGSPDGGFRMKTVKRGKQRQDQMQKLGRKRGIGRIVSLTAKLLALFLFGTVYGVVVSHLHDRRELAAVQVGGVDRQSWVYLAAWGLAGVVLGILLPYVDLVTDRGDGKEGERRHESHKEAEMSLYEQWNLVFRSFGAFLAIAFAIRRLPWESTLQLTVTLALVNPALWHLLDRTKNGLLLSLASTSIITSFIFLSNPDVLPSPVVPARSNTTHLPSPSSASPDFFAGVVSYGSLVTATWLGSVVFCSCICFGGIGRRLAVLDEW